MKTTVTVISASVLVALSASASAGSSEGSYGYPYYGYAPYAYAPYAYAPYGYGVPVPPPAQLTEEQRKALQDQQARAFEYVQNMQRQMAKYYADHPDSIYSMERRMFEDELAHMQDMNKMIQESQEDINRDIRDSLSPYPLYRFGPAWAEDSARLQELEKEAQEHRKAAEERREAFLKAAKQRRLEAEKRYREHRMQHDYRTATPVAPKANTPEPEAAKTGADKS
jgi:predicted HicB family RNase H-like nuclease